MCPPTSVPIPISALALMDILGVQLNSHKPASYVSSRVRSPSPKRQYEPTQPGQLIQPQIMEGQKEESDEEKHLVPTAISSSALDEEIYPSMPSWHSRTSTSTWHLQVIYLDILLEVVQRKPHKLCTLPCLTMLSCL